MKNHIVILAAVLMMGTGCRKGAVNNDDRNALLGKWKLVYVRGGLRALNLTAPEWGHTLSYDFKRNYSCTYTYDGNSSTKSYRLSRDKSYMREAQANFITIKGDYELKYEYWFAHDTLVLSDDPRVDGGSEWFVRE